jgi:hypothetical protein
MNIRKIIREEMENDLKWIEDVSDKKHLYGVVLLNNDYKLIYIDANDIDELWEIYGKEYNKGLDPMLYSIDDRVLKGFGGIEPKADIARKIHEELEDFNWVRGGNKWDELIDSLELLANNRSELPTNPEYNQHRGWNRKDFKIWLGEISDEEYKQFRDAANNKGFRGTGDENWVIDSLYVTVDREYSKKSDRVIFGVMGCQKEENKIAQYFWNKYSDEEKEMRLCRKVSDTEYKIKPEKLEFDRDYFEDKNAQELFPFD